MRKYLLTAIFLVLILLGYAQTAPTKKTPLQKPAVTKAKPVAPKKPIIKFKPPIIKKDHYVYDAPPPRYSEGVSISTPPMVMESAEATKYRKERICSTCDTLKLEPNVRHIIIYDVKWMSNSESRTYFDQPTQSDLSNDHYALSGLDKREWDELQRNFPETEYKYHYIFRNTIIETPNAKKQTLNLLDRQERHEGFLYWSGNENDSTVNQTKMARLTELIAQKVGEKKISSYYEKFKKDSLAVELYQRSFNPSEKLKENMNLLLQKELFGETVIPFQFITLNAVSKITVQSVLQADKKITFNLNRDAQITKIFDGRRDSTVITYKNNLPDVAVRQSQTFKFYYQGDKVIMKEKNYVSVFKLVGKVFFDVERYRIEAKDYEDMLIKQGNSKLINEKCLEETDELTQNFTGSACYNNTAWQLPVSIVNKGMLYKKVIETTTSYTKNDSNTIVVETINPYRSRKFEYIIHDTKFTALNSFSKKEGKEYGEPYVLEISYEYFK